MVASCICHICRGGIRVPRIDWTCVNSSYVFGVAIIDPAELHSVSDAVLGKLNKQQPTHARCWTWFVVWKTTRVRTCAHIEMQRWNNFSTTRSLFFENAFSFMHVESSAHHLPNSGNPEIRCRHMLAKADGLVYSASRSVRFDCHVRSWQSKSNVAMLTAVAVALICMCTMSCEELQSTSN